MNNNVLPKFVSCHKKIYIFKSILLIIKQKNPKTLFIVCFCWRGGGGGLFLCYCCLFVGLFCCC